MGETLPSQGEHRQVAQLAERLPVKERVAGSNPALPAIGDSMDIDQRIDLISALNQLTPRQRRVLVLWAAGYTHKEIAKEYGLTRQRISQICAESICLLGDSIPFNDEGSM